MISLRPVTRDDLDVLFDLQVDPTQRGFVAPNAVTLAEIHYITGGYVFAIEADEAIVGLVAMIDFREHDDLLEGDDPMAAFMLRLMIGSEHQRRGYGRAATAHAIDWARARDSTSFQTSIAPANDVARKLYRSLGMKETGRMVEGEVEMSLDLRKSP